ncbi:CBL-interacting protein kinase 18-like [Papaver somniferum]|uniref:CBL-interacting protein kinase 18-like n=1 Tax=Papaver somniferum TaxID=3469 RepID=UPI000E702726|nr:CBL-interacting protein kinase 18-like [Papaver somniferum]
MDTKTGILMEKYELGRVLGQGTFAKVYYARNLQSGQSVAIKVIDKDKVMKVGLIEQIKREISIMKLVRHPNVVQLYEVMATRTKIYFAVEYCKGGELFNKVAKGKLKEDVARKYFQQLVSAVDFCHSRGVYHRDLKPENLLLDDNGNLKVSDFGLSALAESTRQDGLLHTTCGTPAYVAPEVISRHGYDGVKADIWSCGVILFVLLAGYLPFQDANLMEMYRKIGRGEFKFPNWFPADVRRLLSKILIPNPYERISMAKIMESSWFRKGLNAEVEKPSRKNKGPSLSSMDVDALFSRNNDNSGTSSSETKPTNLNAFDIISLSAGFDLSGLFEKTDNKKKESRFMSRQPAPTIISALEDAAQRLRLKVKKKDGGHLKFEGTKEGRKGVLSIDAEIFEVTPSFHWVEMKKSSGDTMEYQNMLEHCLRPALKDIIWVWQGDQPRALQPQTRDEQQEEQQQEEDQEQNQQQQQPQQEEVTQQQPQQQEEEIQTLQPS